MIMLICCHDLGQYLFLIFIPNRPSTCVIVSFQITNFCLDNLKRKPLRRLKEDSRQTTLTPATVKSCSATG